MARNDNFLQIKSITQMLYFSLEALNTPVFLAPWVLCVAGIQLVVENHRIGVSKLQIWQQKLV